MGATAYTTAPQKVEEHPNRLCRPELRCSATTPRGPCRAPRRPSSGFCFRHDPTLTECRILSCSKGGRTPRQASIVPALVRFDWDSLAKPEGMERLRRLVLTAMLQGQLKAGVARFILEQAEKVRAAMPRQSDDAFTRRLLERLRGPVAEPPSRADDDEEEMLTGESGAPPAQ